MKKAKYILTLPVIALFMSCGGGDSTSNQANTNSDGAAVLEGSVSIDGSSTVYPITEAVAEEYREVQPKVRVTIGVSGTGGGFKKFGRGETDISNASREIKAKEDTICRGNGIDYLELEVAYDGLSVVVNPANDWCTEITTEELKTMWDAASQEGVTKWSQIREGWPDEEFHLFGPGVENGTYDYFKEAIVGKKGSTRNDFTASEDDNVLVQGVSGDKYALGFFGLAYYEENKDKLNVVAVDGGSGPVKPSLETVLDKSYAPLSRPLFIYANSNAKERSEVADYINFYLKNAGPLAQEVGYIPLQDAEYKEQQEKFKAFLEK